ncbi:hypothetical protein [Apibacter sp. HY039]|uniref:hypothetical protein n=1 Tax=Apibacter sp. HY039 TaxID=2501476 RepID=UPI000FEBDC25|nr:hypothetical protein [Apibacter sp. HY039]
MNKNLNQSLINTIKEFIPVNINAADFLSEILDMGKESAYRRLRGEINFSFNEVVLLSSRLGFSLDHLVRNEPNKNALYELDMLSGHEDLFDVYQQRVEFFTRFFKNACQYPNHLKMANNTIPYIFSLEFKELSRLYLYKWVYQQKLLPQPFSEFEIPKIIRLKEEECFYYVNQIQRVQITLDVNVFKSVIQDIVYFSQLELISKDSLNTLKNELLGILAKIENFAIHGKSNSHEEIMIYLSSIFLDSTYLYFEYGNKQFSSTKIYSLLSLNSEDPEVCQIHKNWINSLKKYSVLISQSGEPHRIRYFNQQKDLIDKM